MELNRTSLLSDANLVSYWRFEDNYEDSKNSNDGTVINNIVIDSSGKFTKCAMCSSSTSSRISIAAAENLRLTNNFTLSLWCKQNSTGLTSKYLINKGASIPLSEYSIIYGYNAGKYEFYAENFTGSNPRTALNTSVDDTNWHHIVWTYDGTTLKGYLDGNLDISVTITFSLANSASTLSIFASSSDSLNQFLGRIDDISIFNRALTASEISTLYNIKAWTLNLTETTTLSEIFNKVRSKFKSYLETSSLLEIFGKNITRIFSETKTLSEVFNRVKNKFKLVTDTSTLSDPDIDVIKSKGLEFNSIVNLSDFIFRSWSSAKSFVDNITSSDLFTKIRGCFYTLIDTHTLTDSFTKSQVTNRNLNDSMSLLDSIKKYLNGFVLSRWIKKAKAVITFSKVAKPSNTWTKTEKPDDL